LALLISCPFLETEDIKDGWLLKQMPNGFGPVLSITMKEQRLGMRISFSTQNID
jgi:hypothetical protein